MVLPTRPKTSLLRRLCSPRNPLVWLFVLFILIWTIINNEDGAVDNSFLLGQRNDMIRSGSSSSSANVKDEGHRVAGLVCDSYGGPLTSAATNEMVYWRDIPQDTSFQSPFRTQATEELFFTFEPDEGGWNNIRMAMETAIAMAVAMGRTLVLPPKMHFYLLWNGANQDQNVFDFADFFHLDSVAAEHGNQALKVITLEEFLRRQAMTGQLLDSKTGLPSFPPGNKTDWRGSVINYQAASSGEGKVLWEWMRSVTTVLPWSYEQCVATFPSRPGKADADGMDAYLAQLKTRDMAIFGGDGGKSWHSLWQQRRNSFNSNPAPVNGSATDRLAELLANRRNLCVYTEELQKAKVVHVLGEQRTGYRLLIHFYAYLFFEDWKQDLWIKRFIRDHFRYVKCLQ